MKRDTRPEIPRTRIIDVPAEPTMDQMRGDALRDRLILDADLIEKTFQRPIAAALLRGIAAALGEDSIVTASPVEQAAYVWGLFEDADDDLRGWVSLLLGAAAATMRAEPLLHDFFAGAAAAIDDHAIPGDASSAWRMGHNAIRECLGKRPGYTQVVEAAEPPPLLLPEPPIVPHARPPRSAVRARPPAPPARARPPQPPQPPVRPELDDEQAVTRPHGAATAPEPSGILPSSEPAPPPLLDEPWPIAPPREADAPVPRRGRVSEEGLTTLHAKPRSVPLRRPR